MENKDCNKGILRIFPHIDIDCINTFVDNVPYIGDLQKDFYKTYIIARYEKILLPVYGKLNKWGMTYDFLCNKTDFWKI